ncbi:MAG TPA: hypothetical protein VEW04_08315 [Allosphingosinicella sp.]|nr:hypothetical protein [Allosphingosinicella sp.]
MTPFELFFGLTSVILALALTHLANSFQLLLRRGRAVHWAIEPVLQAVLIFMILVFVWVDQWHDRNVPTITVAQSLLQVLKLLAVYVVAAAVLPEPTADEGIDLQEHYMRSRYVTYGALLVGLFLFIAYRYLFYPPEHVPINDSPVIGLVLLLTYVSLMIVRWRPWHIAGLTLVCLLYAIQIAPVAIGR